MSCAIPGRSPNIWKAPIRIGRRCSAAKSGTGFRASSTRFTDRHLIGKLVPSMMLDVLGLVDAEDAAHLRKLERLFKKSMEEMAAQREQSVTDFRRALDPLRVTLRWQPFLWAQRRPMRITSCSRFSNGRASSAKTELLEPADALASRGANACSICPAGWREKNRHEAQRKGGA